MGITDWIMIFILFVFVIFWLLPLGLLILFPFPRSHYDTNPDKPITKNYTNSVYELTQKIEALGFLKLGRKIERQLSSFLWFNPQYFYDFASYKDLSFASVLVHRKKAYYYFYTPFSEGPCILTANDGFIPVESSDLIISVVPTEPEELLLIHKKRVESLISADYTPYHEYTKEARLQATSQYYKSPTVIKRTRQPGVILFILSAFIVFIIWTWYFFG